MCIRKFFKKKYEKENFDLLLTECKKIREQKIDEFIKDFENQIKEAMVQGRIKTVKRGTVLHACEKDRIIRHFTAKGFDIDFHAYVQRGITTGCKFTVQWQHLLK